MTITPTPEMILAWKFADSTMSGTCRRLFRATIATMLGWGGRLFLRDNLAWSYPTLDKGLAELAAGKTEEDRTSERGRHTLVADFPDLETHLKAMAEPASQTDPTFKTTKIYCRLTGKDARRRLIDDHGYAAATAPSARTLRRMLTRLGFHPMKVRKSKPLKKIKETNEIFEALAIMNPAADADPGVVRISIDTKTSAAIGNLSRGGKSRVHHEALDHDHVSEGKVTPFGILRSDTKEVWLAFTTGSVSADFMADRLEEIWPTLKKTIILRIPCS